MPIISAIKPQKNQKRVNIYLDGKFGFGLDLENYLKFGLKVEQELTEAEIEKIIKKAEFQKTLDKLLRFATLRPRSEKEIADYFKRRKVHPSLHQDLFKRLKHLDLLDDLAFSRWWVEQRLSFKPRGKKALAYELRAKGIARDITDQVLTSLDLDELKIAKELLQKRSKQWEREKAVAYLSRKGFSWSVVDQAVDEVVK